jgi:hypothetical protein
MKKVILTTVCVAALSTGAFAQGLLNFLNSATTLVTLRSNGVALGATPAASLGTYRYELFRAPAGTLTSSAFVSSGLIATNLTTAGRLNGGNGLTVPGTALGGTSAIMVRGWSSNLGQTYAEAKANYDSFAILGFLGESAIAPNFLMGGDGGSGPVPNSPVFGASANQITSGFELIYSIPEPTSMTLAGLGAAALLIFRRRK